MQTLAFERSETWQKSFTTTGNFFEIKKIVTVKKFPFMNQRVRSSEMIRIKISDPSNFGSC